MVLWLDDVVDVTVPLDTLDSATVEQYYRDGAALYQVAIAKGEEGAVVPEIRAYVDSLGSGNAVSGDAADNAQMQQSMVEQVFMAVAIIVPVIMFLLVGSTMSWIEPVLFIAAIGVSILINMGTNVFLGEVSFVTYSVSPILQLAVSLDYAIFLLHAFADEREAFGDAEKAMASAMRKSMGTIAASAVTTLFGFAALSFMQFQIGADLGVNLVKGIVLSFATVVVLPRAHAHALQAHRQDASSASHADVQERRLGSSPCACPRCSWSPCSSYPPSSGRAASPSPTRTAPPDTSVRTGADTQAVRDVFGQQNMVAVLVPRGDLASEAELAGHRRAGPCHRRRLVCLDGRQRHSSGLSRSVRALAILLG